MVDPGFLRWGVPSPKLFIGGSRVATSGPPPPLRPKKLSISCMFFGKFGKIVCWHSPGGSAPPSTGLPWIRPCLFPITELHNNNLLNYDFIACMTFMHLSACLPWHSDGCLHICTSAGYYTTGCLPGRRFIFRT